MRPLKCLGHGGGLRAFAGGWAAHEGDDKGRTARHGIAQRPLRVPPRQLSAGLPVGVRHFLLSGTDGLHFRPDVGAVRLVKRLEPPQVRIRKPLGHALDKPAPQIRPSRYVQVHRQEGHIVGDVEHPKPLVELDAVEYRHPLVGDVGMIEPQVAVSFNHTAASAAAVKERGVAVQFPVEEILQGIEGRAFEDGPHIRCGLLEILIDIHAQVRDPSGLRGVRRGLQLPVKRAEPARDAVDMICRGLAPRDPLLQGMRRVRVAHLYRVLHDRALDLWRIDA